MPVTMRDVARAANVSVRTVSRVVNGQGEISEQTRQRVLLKIEELGYRPSKLARALVTRHTETIGLVLADITNPFFPQVARGAMDIAQQRGYNLFLCNSDGDWEKEISILHSLADHGVDGIIIHPAWGGGDILRECVKRFAPVVAINASFDCPGVSHVLLDTRGGAFQAVSHLIERGHTHIGMLAGSPPSQGSLRRTEGFREALETHGLPVVDEWILAGPVILDHGIKATHQLLTQYPQITALFTYNDLLAIGALLACREMGLRVPDDCAIAGFDDIPTAAIFTPSLTTVHVNKYELGQLAAKRLFDMLDNPEATFSPIHLDTKIIIREST